MSGKQGAQEQNLVFPLSNSVFFRVAQITPRIQPGAHQPGVTPPPGPWGAPAAQPIASMM